MELKPETQDHMRALCREISVAQGLDEEIQEELYCHMEDKLLAYLNGEEPVMEEDAIILVREHFGDPATVKGMMHKVYVLEAQASLGRRIGLAVLATLAINQLLELPRLGLFQISVQITQDFFLRMVFMSCVSLSVSLLAALALWSLLRHYQRAIDQGRCPWFFTARPVSLVLGGVLLLGLYKFYPGFGLPAGAMPLTQPQESVLSFLRFFGWLPLWLSCLIWLWWCDRPPRSLVAVTVTAGAWILLFLMRGVASTIGIDMFGFLSAHAYQYARTLLEMGAIPAALAVLAYVVAIRLKNRPMPSIDQS